MKSDEKRTFYNLLKRNSEQFADINALISGEYKINYSELFKKASELAAVYQKKGFSGKKIDLSPAMSCEWIIVFFALVMSGAIVVLHEPFLRQHRIYRDEEKAHPSLKLKAQRFV